MHDARWHPTNVAMPNGHVAIFSGRMGPGIGIVSGGVVGWGNPGAHSARPAAVSPLVRGPDGNIFMADMATSRYFDPTGAGTGSPVAPRLYGARSYGAAVMYDRGKVMYVGGARTTNTAEIIDLNSAAPAWQWTGSMAFPRRHLNATVLPTGEILVTGGTGGTG